MAGSVATETDRTHVRLAELVAALSLGIDLGFGQPMEHVLRQCLIALRLAEAVGLDPGERATLYYVALLENVGCHTDAHEQVKWFSDDIAMKATKYDHDLRSLSGALASLRMLGSGRPPLDRLKLGIEFVRGGHRELDEMISQHCRMASTLARQLGLPSAVCDGLATDYERWDGKGWPGELEGEAIPIAARIVTVAEFVEVANRIGGPAAVRELVRERRGAQFDPALCDLLDAEAEVLLSGLDDVGSWDAVIAAEPALSPVLSGDRIDTALQAIADFIDLKSPYFLGHARAVSALAFKAAEALALGTAEQALVRRAALVLGFGRLGISNAIWDKPGALGAGEWERARMQPHLTERMLRQAQSLDAVAATAVQHRERIDGSGYPRGLQGGAVSPAGRLLGTAEAYQAMREPRPHRPALDADAAAEALRAEVKAGRMEAAIVDAVLAAAGHRVRARREGPAGLTAREVEVLRLLARGLSNKDIGCALVISPKTVGNHVEHIYSKIGASNRASASLFAIRAGLLPDETFLAT